MYLLSMQDTTASRIRAARERTGLTQTDLAEKALGKATNARLIHNWETGRFVPRLESLRKIAAVLNCSVHELIPDSTIPEAM